MTKDKETRCDGYMAERFPITWETVNIELYHLTHCQFQIHSYKVHGVEIGHGRVCIPFENLIASYRCVCARRVSIGSSYN